MRKLGAFIEHGFRLAWSYKLNSAARYISSAVSLTFFYFLDQMFRRSGVTVVEGSSYFSFLLIGSAMSRYLDLGMRSFAENLREEMLRGTLEPLLTTATPTAYVLLAPSVWALIEGTVLVFVQLGLGALLGADFGQANWMAAITISLLSIACLLSYGILSAAFTLVFKRSDPLNWLIGSIAYVFGGVYFPVTILPPALRVVSYLLPFTYALQGLRGALLRGSSLPEMRTEVLALVAFTAVLLPLALWSLRLAIRRLKRTGELAHH